MDHTYLDIHTHNDKADKAIISVSPGFEPESGKFYSVGIHPWNTELDDLDRRMEMLASDAAREEVVAIGETGIDKLKGAVAERQIDVLRTHIALSEKLHKPLILHIVKAYPEIIRLKKELRPLQPWIIHGFRGKPELAKELVRHGFYISLGERFNKEVADIVPRDRLLAETDESDIAINDIASGIQNLDNSLPFAIFGIDKNKINP